MDDPGLIMIVSLLIGTVGFAMFIYGRRQSRLPHLAAGILLMGYPYFVSNPLLSGGIAVVILALVAVASRLGV